MYDCVVWMNFFIVILSMLIGMKEWFAPQISEHCPVMDPSFFEVKIT